MVVNHPLKGLISWGLLRLGGPRFHEHTNKKSPKTTHTISHAIATPPINYCNTSFWRFYKMTFLSTCETWRDRTVSASILNVPNPGVRLLWAFPKSESEPLSGSQCFIQYVEQPNSCATLPTGWLIRIPIITNRKLKEVFFITTIDKRQEYNTF